MKKLLLCAALVVAALNLSACGVEIVDAGSTGVKKTLGKVEEETLPPGFYMVNPFTTSITEMDNQVQAMTGTTPTYTRDVQQASVTFVLNYNLQPKASARMYQEVGENYEERLIPQVVNGSMKNVIGRWNAIDLVANREKASLEIEAMTRDDLATRGISVSKFELTDIKFAGQFEDAVEDKVVAVQRAEEAKNKTVEIEENAKQQVIAAKAEAEAMQIKTNALRQSQSLVFYEAVQKWDGHLPRIVTGEAGTILNISKDIAGEKPQE